MGYKKDVFYLHLEGAKQTVAAGATAATWNGLCSLIECENTAAAVVTLAAATNPGTVLSVKKTSGSGAVLIQYPAATNIATLSPNVNDQAVFIWDGAAWDKISSTELQTVNSFTVAKANIGQATSRNTGVTANGISGLITTTSGAMTANTVYSFSLTNSYITTTSRVIVCFGNNATDVHRLAAHTMTNGSCTITYTSDNSTASPAVEIQYFVV